MFLLNWLVNQWDSSVDRISCISETHTVWAGTFTFPSGTCNRVLECMHGGNCWLHLLGINVQSSTELYRVLHHICAKAMRAESMQSTVDVFFPHLARNCMNWNSKKTVYKYIKGSVLLVTRTRGTDDAVNTITDLTLNRLEDPRELSTSSIYWF